MNYTLKYESRMEHRRTKVLYEKFDSIDDAINFLVVGQRVDGGIYMNTGILAHDYPCYIWGQQENKVVMTSNAIIKRVNDAVNI